MKRAGFARAVRAGVAAGVVAVGFGLPAAASAQTLYTGTQAPDAGAADTFTAARSTPGLAAPMGSQSSSRLALTGSDLVEVSLVGLGAVATGAVLVRRSRRAT